MLCTERLENDVLDFEMLKKNLDKVTELIHNKQVLSTYALGFAGIAEAIAKMTFGNRIGFKFKKLCRRCIYTELWKYST